MYGNSNPPQTEETPMHPRSPYGAAKLFGHEMARVYRESYKMWISCGILFNHTSERRGIEFVSQKICQGVASIKLNKSSELKLGNLDSKRDFGYAKDYINAMWKILQIDDKPQDFVISTGESHSIKEFADTAFKYVGLDYKDYVTIDPTLVRPAEINDLRGDCSKANKVLGWQSNTNFESLVKIMVDARIDHLTNKSPTTK